MTFSDPSKPVPQSRLSDVLSAVRYYLGTRLGLLAIASVAIGLGAYSSWGWLVAAGLAPIILATAPCAVMCALGLCMNMNRKTSASNDEQTSALDSGTQSSVRPPLRLAATATESESDVKHTPLTIASPDGSPNPRVDASQSTPVIPRDRQGCC